MMDPNAMSCNDWEEKLAFVDELSASEREALDLHLASCLSCARILQEYRTMQILIQNLPVTGPQPEFPSRLRQLWESEKLQTAELEKAKLVDEASRTAENSESYHSIPQFRYVVSASRPELGRSVGYWARRRRLLVLWLGIALLVQVMLLVIVSVVNWLSSPTSLLTMVAAFSIALMDVIVILLVGLFTAGLCDWLYMLKMQHAVRALELHRAKRITDGRIPTVPGVPDCRRPNRVQNKQIDQEAFTNP